MCNAKPKKTCSFEGCDRPHYSKGLCQAHYLQQWKGKELRPLRHRAPNFSSDEERAEHYIDKSGPNGCWEWTGTTMNGYGMTNAKVSDGKWKSQLAHRWAYEHFVGPIPKGLQLKHLCRNRACCNPDHLEPVTTRENNKRMHAYHGMQAIIDEQAARIAELEAQLRRERAI